MSALPYPSNVIAALATRLNHALTVGWRHRARTNPAAHEPDFAASLSNLGVRLSGVGRRDEALTAELEAVEIYYRLAAGNPAAHEPDLAASLCAWAWVRSETQRDLSEALEATEGAVQIYRRLVAAVPALFIPPLRFVLGLRAELLLGFGRAREAEETRAWLAANDPDTGSQK